ncbi:cysteine hydrolase [Candidatus Poriferisocius sp.]|uniref:cysteine hydrolase n=1 Tax=Candidatus Poriferisocius sp. TaxID=3101276 RepID=UPI003B5A9D74
MPVDHDQLLAPAHTAVVTMECQRGVIGDLASMGALRDVMLDRGTIDAGARLCRGARAVGVPVVHCLAHFRADRAGSATNCRMLAAAAKMSEQTGGLLIGSDAAQVIPEFEPQPSDIEVARWHGMSPFMGTPLDQTLRNLGVTTVVAAGVSLNVGVMGLVINAVDLGYQVVLAGDAVAGIPAEYGDAVMNNTMAFLTTMVTVDDIVACWT